MPGVNSQDMESCIWILYVHWKNMMCAERIAFNYGSLLFFLFWQVYLCFLSIAFVKSRGKGHGQECPGKDGPYSPELSWSCKGYTTLCATEQYSAGNSIKATALEEEGGDLLPSSLSWKHYCRPESLFALVHSEQDGPPDCCFLNVLGFVLFF